MALDLETALATQLGFEDDARAREAVARLLLQVVHDVNGGLGTAILRGAGVGRGLARLGSDLDDPAAAEGRLDDVAAAHAALQEALVEMKGLLARLRDAAWQLDEGSGGA